MDYERPLFSIITVCRNAADTILPTMQSVAEQSCKLYEHLVIDGASTDNTVKIARGEATERTVIRSAPDRGIYDAMNKGIAAGKGDYLIFLNAGDTFHTPETLQMIADLIMDNDYPGVVYGQTEIVDEQRRVIGERHLTAPAHLTLASFRDGMVVCHQAFVALRAICPLYSLRYRYSSDYEWCIRVLQHSRHNVYADAVLIDYLNEGMTTRHFRSSLLERFRIMCYYYGVWPTVVGHFRFLKRYMRRRRREAER